MKNKYLLLIVCLLVVFTLVLPACGGGNKSVASPTSTKKTTSQATMTNAADGSLADILGKAANIDSVKYDMYLTAAGESITATIWQKQQKMREEMAVSGTTDVILYDMAAKIMYMYYPAENMATKTTLDSSAIPKGATQETSAILNYNPTVVGTETIDGKVCIVVIYDTMGASVKTWIWKDKGFPLKMEMTNSYGTTTIDFTNLDFSDIPDSMFVLPADVQIVSTGG